LSRRDRNIGSFFLAERFLCHHFVLWHFLGLLSATANFFCHHVPLDLIHLNLLILLTALFLRISLGRDDDAIKHGRSDPELFRERNHSLPPRCLLRNSRCLSTRQRFRALYARKLRPVHELRAQITNAPCQRSRSPNEEHREKARENRVL
jgi:hypothetical protein